MGEILLCPYNITSRRGNRTLSILDFSHPRIQVSSVMRAYKSMPINSEKFFPTNNTSAGIQKYTHDLRGEPPNSQTTSTSTGIQKYTHDLRGEPPHSQTTSTSTGIQKYTHEHRVILSQTTFLTSFMGVYTLPQRETLTPKPHPPLRVYKNIPTDTEKYSLSQTVQTSAGI